MTLDGKKSKSSSKNYRPQYIIPTEKGILYTPTGETWEYPLFIGEKVISHIGPEPLKIEFLFEGKSWIFIFYDKKLGMIAKAKIPRKHAMYILQEMISRRGNIPPGGIIDEKLLNEILSGSTIKLFTR